MGCVSGTNARPAVPVQVTFNQTTFTLPAVNSERGFRLSVQEHFPDLRNRAWYFHDPLTASDVLTPEAYQRLITAIKTRAHPIQLLVRLDIPVSFSPENPLFHVSKSVFAVMMSTGIVGNGVFLGKKLALVPAGLSKVVFSCVCSFGRSAQEVNIPVEKGFLHELKDCETIVIKLDLSDPKHREYVESLSPVVSKRREKQGTIKDLQVACLHHTIRSPVLKFISFSLLEESSRLITVSGQLQEGSLGSPLFYQDGGLAGLNLAHLDQEKQTFIRAEKLAEGMKGLGTVSEIAALNWGNEEKVEEEDEEIEFNVVLKTKKESALQEEASASPQPMFQFDIDDTEPAIPVNPKVHTIPSVQYFPKAFYLNNIRGGTELWRLAKADYSLKKEFSEVQISKTSSVVDTSKGLVITGGEDAASQKSWLWAEDGLRVLVSLSYPHSRHASVLLGSRVFVISGDATNQVECVDLETQTVSSVKELVKKRYNAGACAIAQGALFLAGGYVGPQGKPSRSILEYRAHSDSWLKVEFSLTTPTSALGLCFIQPNTLLVIGGKNAQAVASAEAYLVDIRSGVRVASLHLPEPATFTQTHPVRDEDSFLIFTDEKFQFEYDIVRQRFYLLSVSSESNKI